MTITIIAGHDLLKNNRSCRETGVLGHNPQKDTSWCQQILYGFSGHLLLASQDVERVKQWFITRGVDSSIIVDCLGKLQKTGETIAESKLARVLPYGTQKVKVALEGICYRSYLGRGVLPEPKVDIKKPKKAKKRPIKKQVKINARTEEIYSNKDFEKREMFSMKTVIVGYEEIAPPKSEEKVQQKAPKTKIRSWVGLLIDTLEKCKDCESIHRRFFFRKSDQCA